REVTRLMDLFMRALDKEARELHENNVRVRFIGDLSAFSPELQQKVRKAEEQTRNNDRMLLNVAANYGGRWDIVNAARAVAADVAAGRLQPGEIDEAVFARRLALADSGDPDLFIRTGGEVRVSNFLLWQSAYTELYFTPVLWPDFDSAALDQAIEAFRSRERRFGRTGEQVRVQSA
ncbi:MAG: polyprenyl diphosphate synthase, partial [Xanthomonadales bacterium]|nr:polyprenyl diphosphate synthase [Xanthomonadales bacterium]